MTDIQKFKSQCLEYLHRKLRREVAVITSSPKSHQNKAKDVNKQVSQHRKILESRISKNLSAAKQQEQLIVLQYCISVVSLEYRHAVWPYEYMAFSRRVGELWERFCISAWDIPTRKNLVRTKPPAFEKVFEKVNKDLLKINGGENQEAINKIFADLKDMIGDINMIEDEVCTLDDVLHVIDFKSGFGSNEKGNMLRLRTVGKAYRLWNPDTRLLFLVRQEKNNNYLEVIKKEGLWEVHCGPEAYTQIDEITGANMNYIRKEVVNFEPDLSQKFWTDLSSHLSDLSDYLRW